MNSKRLKKFFSLVLTGALLATLSVSAFADDEEPETELDPEIYDVEAYEEGIYEAETEAQLQGEYEPNALIIKFHPISMFEGKEHQYNQAVEQALRWGFKNTPIDGIADTYVVYIEDFEKNPNAVMNRFKNNRFIEYVEPNHLGSLELVPNDSLYTSNGRTHANFINAEKGWAITTNSNVLVAVIDSGYHAANADLNSTVTGWNVLDKNTNLSDSVGHGTQVAGTVGAIGNNKTGTTGVVWNANIMPVKITNNTSVNAANVASGITWAVDNGARIINLSLSFTSDNVTVRNAVNYALERGCIVVAATGNNAKNTVNFPAALPNVLGVGGTSDGRTRAANSNFGTGLDVLGSWSWATPTNTNTGYVIGSGTSFASPQVAGLAALVWELAPNLTNAQVMDLIRANTNRGNGVWDSQTGFGVIDMGKTLAAAKELSGAPAAPPVTAAPPAATTAPPANAAPPVPPVITHNGSNPIILHLGGSAYVEQGAKAYDDKDGDISKNVKVTSNVDTTKAGTYFVIYSVTNSAGITSSITREVRVLAPNEIITRPPASRFSGQGKAGERFTYNVDSQGSGNMTLAVSGLNKVTVTVTVRDSAGKQVFSQVYSANATHTFQVVPGRYTAEVVIGAGSGNMKFDLALTPPDSVAYQFADSEVPLGTLEFGEETAGGINRNTVIITVSLIALLGATVVLIERNRRKNHK